MRNKITALIEEIEQTEALLREQSPKNIGKNLAKYVRLKEKYNKLSHNEEISP